MTNKIKELENDLEALLYQGRLLCYSMAFTLKVKIVSNELKTINKLKEENKLPHIHDEYESWYSESMSVIELLINNRLKDFIHQYKNGKEYCIYDYLIDNRMSELNYVKNDHLSALQKLRNQVSILQSALIRCKNSLFDIKTILQSDLFDSELESSKELNKHKFIRPSGALAGVVLEKHLEHICKNHNVTPQIKNHTISVLNQTLKRHNIIDTEQVLFIDRLGALRNLCVHHKPEDREPTQDDANELIKGVEKVIKTVF